jgi:hypothetical protein
MKLVQLVGTMLREKKNFSPPPLQQLLAAACCCCLLLLLSSVTDRILSEPRESLNSFSVVAAEAGRILCIAAALHFVTFCFNY